MSDRSPLLRAVHKQRIRSNGKREHLELQLACGHRVRRELDHPTVASARCYDCEAARDFHLHAEPLPHLRLTHYGL